MGLHTTYVGHLRIEPPLAPSETRMLRQFNQTRHWDHPDGPWQLATHPSDNDRGEAAVARYNATAEGVPQLWCPWTACEEGHCLHWDGDEKPYAGEQWLSYLIHSFLAPGAKALGTSFAREHGLTCDHVLNGMVVGERQETLELFALEVCDNLVLRRTLLAGEPRGNEWGSRGRAAAEDSRLEHLRARKERFERAVADDRARVRKRA